MSSASRRTAGIGSESVTLALAEPLIRRGEPMSLHTTFQIGGPAEYFAEAKTVAEMSALLGWASRRRIRSRVIGSGANLLVSDSGVAGLIIVNRMGQCRLRPSVGLVTAGSGALIADVAVFCSENGWTGLEWAVGVPGTVGGAVVGNAGAFGGYIADVLKSVTTLEGGTPRRLSRADCGFGYRTSRFKGGCSDTRVLVSCEMTVRHGDRGAIAEKVGDYTARRASSQPWQPSAGSVFKRTAEHPAGWLIEQAGLKGRQAGAAQISEQHANFIVNNGGATAGEVRKLIELARHEVKARFGIDLELEIELVG